MIFFKIRISFPYDHNYTYLQFTIILITSVIERTIYIYLVFAERPGLCMPELFSSDENSPS